MGSLNCQHIYKYYKGENKPAVSDFCLQITNGEFLVLVGPSGCGKSTMLRMIAGLESISNGDLYIDDRFVNYASPKNRDISMVFQNYALYPNLSVFENMALGLKLRKMAKHEVELKVNRAARILEIPHLLEKLPNQLSGGQKQRVALGRAIVREPQVFLMDEPLSNLDAKLRAQTRAEIIKLHSKLKTTTIYVTHDQTEAMTMGTRIVVMKDGEIQQVSAPRELYTHPCNMFVAGFIGSPQMNFLQGSITLEQNKYYFQTKRIKWEIPNQYGAALQEASSNLRQVVLGIRPEHVTSDISAIDKYVCGTTSGTLEIIELMGSDTFLFVNIGDSTVIVRVETSNASVGDTVEVAFRLDKIHIFDGETEISITSQGVAIL